MGEISTKYLDVKNNNAVTPAKRNIPAPTRSIAAGQITVDEYWRREKRKNSGLIERLYNSIKNITGIGTGTKKIDKYLEDLKNRKISQQEFSHNVKNYSASQENSAQLLGDAASIGAAGITFFSLNKFFKYANGYLNINKEIVDKVLHIIKKESKNTTNASAKAFNYAEKAIKTFSSNKRLNIFTIGLTALAGGITKLLISSINRIGSDEFKVDTSLYGTKKTRTPSKKVLAKKSKKRLNKERRLTNFKNFISGAINGLMMPVMFLGGFIGTPIYLLGNSLNRYYVANRTDKRKSISGYIDNLANDGITMGTAAAAAAIPLVKKGEYVKLFNENMKNVTAKLAKTTLEKPNFAAESAYTKLEKNLLSSPKIKSIIENRTDSVQKTAQKLIDENIFAAKFKQISNDGTELFKVLKEDCPPTRTLEEAQKYITDNIGSGYNITKLLGVGTVAETYFAKGPDGKEVCIKILKNGINKDKILSDKEKFVEIIKNLKDTSQEEIDYLIRNIDDLADGILKEVDLKNEMDAAMKLAPITHAANVVKPIKVENNVYIMERAKGVSLESFMRLNALYVRKEAAEKIGGDKGKKLVETIEQEIEKVQARMPGFDDIKLKRSDTDYLLQEYQKVFIEQFHKIDKNGKIMHGDLHPGNIFIDPNVLKSRKGKLYTLIDTGNTINMSVEQSMRALNFTKYVKQGNIQDISEFVLDGAKLPEGMTKDEAIKKVSNELKECFFNDKTEIGVLNDEKVLTLTDNIMQKYNIIPSSTQLNLNKSRTSAKNSYDALKESILAMDAIDIMAEFKNGSKISATTKSGKAIVGNLFKDKQYETMINTQEQLNLKQLTPAERYKQKHNPNAPKTNSEDYITYKLKQQKYNIKDMFNEDLD